MYGMCSICQDDQEFQDAYELLKKIDKANRTPDVCCQLGLMAIHAGDTELAMDCYDYASDVRTQSPLIRLNAQWIALLLGRPDLVAESCVRIGKQKQSNSFSNWEELEWEVLSGKLSSEDTLLERAGDERKAAGEGLLSLALMRLADRTPEARAEAIRLLEEAVSIRAVYFTHYTTKALLHDLDDPDWPYVTWPGETE